MDGLSQQCLEGKIGVFGAVRTQAGVALLFELFWPALPEGQIQCLGDWLSLLPQSQWVQGNTAAALTWDVPLISLES